MASSLPQGTKLTELEDVVIAIRDALLESMLAQALQRQAHSAEQHQQSCVDTPPEHLTRDWPRITTCQSVGTQFGSLQTAGPSSPGALRWRGQVLCGKVQRVTPSRPACFDWKPQVSGKAGAGVVTGADSPARRMTSAADRADTDAVSHCLLSSSISGCNQSETVRMIIPSGLKDGTNELSSQVPDDLNEPGADNSHEAIQSSAPMSWLQACWVRRFSRVS